MLKRCHSVTYIFYQVSSCHPGYTYPEYWTKQTWKYVLNHYKELTRNVFLENESYWINVTSQHSIKQAHDQKSKVMEEEIHIQAVYTLW